ncbi:GGDEF domain-containing protein [Paramixta manurensis]|uniref:diguanylate cyclase n=1 Tax=Paramixta manurensis TaxID=2740817 RepID=A0A6M8UJC2_9GAMM|nr:GGDEF domain-containing protein [Erwiniaceae bacterium PD-1]
MSLDVYTLFICELAVLAFLSIVMLFAWSGSQYDRVLGFTSAALVMILIAVFLSSLRTLGLQFLPVGLGNIMLLLGYGMLLNAFRVFAGQPCGYSWLGGALLWALLCLFPAFYYSLPKRIIVSCLLCIIYIAALIQSLSRSRSALRITFWPARLLLWIHLCFHVLRIFLDQGSVSPLRGAIGGSTFSVYVIMESILFVIGLTFTIMAMVNERTQIKYKQASLLDPLTGVWNRRALFIRAEKLEARCLQHNAPLSVILFDLDHFKSINDRYGHVQGDRVLIDFCQVTMAALPADAYFSRLGGEEFAAILISSAPNTYALSERIRLAVQRSAPNNVNYSVSIGIATARRKPQFANLMVAADEALYRAKARGRNRVEAFFSDEPADTMEWYPRQT